MGEALRALVRVQDQVQVQVQAQQRSRVQVQAQGQAQQRKRVQARRPRPAQPLMHKCCLSSSLSCCWESPGEFQTTEASTAADAQVFSPFLALSLGISW